MIRTRTLTDEQVTDRIAFISELIKKLYTEMPRGDERRVPVVGLYNSIHSIDRTVEQGDGS